MKKNKKNNKKKLPRFVLGTMSAPKAMGYQPNKGIGDATFQHEEGEDLSGDVKTAKQSLVPNAFNKAMTNFSFAKTALNSWGPTTTSSATATPTLSLTTPSMFPTLSGLSPTSYATSMAAKYAPLLSGGAPAVGTTMGSLSTTGQLGSLSASSPSSFFGTSQLTNPSGNASTLSSGGSSGAQKALGTAGKIAAGIGTAYGLYNVGNDIAHMHDTVGQQQIANSAGTNTYTTAGGSTYKERTGIDTTNIMALERQMANAKKTGLMLDAAGLGASVGSFAGPVGTGIGLVGGALVGGIASLLGFGDNSDKVEEMIKNQQDVFAMQNRQSRATALDQDTRSAFYERGAANGKRPVWTPAGLLDRKATARVSNGEIIGNFADGLVTRVGGPKNNKDTKLANLRDGDFVITNKFGLSDYAAATGDYAGALAAQENIMGMRNSKGYKNGKLPKFVLGLSDRALSLIPHFASLVTNQNALREAQNMPVETKNTYVDNAEGRKSVNTLGSLRFDDTPYLIGAQRAYNQANWDTRRNVGLGIGGRAVAMNAAYRQYLDALAGVNAQKNDADAKYSQVYANALQSLGAANQQHRINAAVQEYQWKQQANAAKYNAIQQYRANRDQAMLNGVAEWLRQGQYQDSLAAQNRMLRLYEDQAARDTIRLNHDLGLDGKTDNQTMDWRPSRYVNTVPVNKTDRFGLISNTIPQLNIPGVLTTNSFGSFGASNRIPTLTNGNSTNAIFNSDGTFVDDFTRVFDNLVVSGKNKR